MCLPRVLSNIPSTSWLFRLLKLHNTSPRSSQKVSKQKRAYKRTWQQRRVLTPLDNIHRASSYRKQLYGGVNNYDLRRRKNDQKWQIELVSKKLSTHARTKSIMSIIAQVGQTKKTVVIVHVFKLWGDLCICMHAGELTRPHYTRGGLRLLKRNTTLRDKYNILP